MILGSLCYASSFIFTKRLSSTDSALAVLFWMSVIQTPISLAAAVPQWVTPVAADFPGSSASAWAASRRTGA